jgi:predicted DNA-binding transcriptional regulator YafY
MERLTQILSMLSGAERNTLSADELLEVVPYGGRTVDNRRDQLRRDLGHLETLGWQIANVAPEGETARYRLTAVDNRLRVEFTPAQRAELLRAASAASLAELFDDLGDDDGAEVPALVVQAERESADLGRVQSALSGHCRLRFVYRDVRRVVHPHALHVKPGGWYLTANEEGSDTAKTFVVSRMSEVSVDAPGTATVPEEPARPQLDPITWLIDDVTEATVSTTAEHQEQVETMLGRPRTVDERDGGTVVLTIPVTHRAAFRRRVYELGTRVRVLGPADLREQMRRELEAVVRGEV